jgi:lysyl-tRNA synthetase class 2
MNEYEQNRRNKLSSIRELGDDGYSMPAGWSVNNMTSLAFTKNYVRDEWTADSGEETTIGGRVVLFRPGGGLSFITIRQDATDMQIAVAKNRADDKSKTVLKQLDLGDFVAAKGRLAKTKTGEPTLWATEFRIVSKAMLPPPAKHEGLSDRETRYRKRYADLSSDPEVLKVFKARASLVRYIRQFLDSRGYVEVETPMMQPSPGGATAKPFRTHMDALDIPLYLRIAPELYLKRLLVGGMSKVFELNRNFRNEGMSTRHNPEFTMLEAYCAYADYTAMMDLVETIVTAAPRWLKYDRDADVASVPVREATSPLRRVRLTDVVRDVTGWDYYSGPMSDETACRLWAPETSVGVAQMVVGAPTWKQLVLAYEHFVEPTLIDPTFVTHFPKEVMPLAKDSKDYPGFAEVFELAMNGQEIAPGYTEQNDPDAQYEAMANQAGDRDVSDIDQDFIEAMRHGMPPAGGIGIGIDRLVVALLGLGSVRDAILFPLMKPLNKADTDGQTPV